MSQSLTRLGLRAVTKQFSSYGKRTLAAIEHKSRVKKNDRRLTGLPKNSELNIRSSMVFYECPSKHVPISGAVGFCKHNAMNDVVPPDPDPNNNGSSSNNSGSNSSSNKKPYWPYLLPLPIGVITAFALNVHKYKKQKGKKIQKPESATERPVPSTPIPKTKENPKLQKDRPLDQQVWSTLVALLLTSPASIFFSQPFHALTTMSQSNRETSLKGLKRSMTKRVQSEGVRVFWKGGGKMAGLASTQRSGMFLTFLLVQHILGKRYPEKPTQNKIFAAVISGLFDSLLIFPRSEYPALITQLSKPTRGFLSRRFIRNPALLFSILVRDGAAALSGFLVPTFAKMLPERYGYAATNIIATFLTVACSQPLISLFDQMKIDAIKHKGNLGIIPGLKQVFKNGPNGTMVAALTRFLRFCIMYGPVYAGTPFIAALLAEKYYSKKNDATEL